MAAQKLIAIPSVEILFMSRIQRTSIAIHLVILIVAILTLFLFLFGFSGYYYYSQHEREGFHDKLSVRSDRVALALEGLIWNMDQDQILRLMKSEMRDPDTYAMLVSYGQSQQGLVRDAAGHLVFSEHPVLPAELVTINKNVVIENQIVGSVTIVATAKYLEARLHQALVLLCLVIFILDIAITVGLILSLRFLVLKPLKLIGIYAGDVVGGASSQASLQKFRFRGELEQLKNAIDAMVTQLGARNDALSESTERFRTLIQKFPIPIGLHDEAGNIIVINEKFTELYGYEVNDVRLMSRWFEQAYPDENYRNKVIENWGKYLNKAKEDPATKPLLYELTCKNREIKYVEISGIVTGHFTLAVLNDVSNRKHAEGAVEKYRLHLEALVQQRTAELELAKNVADTANRAKSIFLANMSHELRTPLNAVIGFSQLMAKDTELSAAQRKNLNIINRSGNHLLSLINAVLELSKIEAGATSLDPEVTSLSALLNETLDMVRVRADQAGLALHADFSTLPAYVVVDGFKLKQILINLLGNAIKFTLAGKVDFSVACKELAPDQVQLTFSVSDTGIGIAAENLTRIFQPFVQLDTHASQVGTGLGLAISRQFVELMGGHLAVESTPGQGSTFHFSLTMPLAAVATGENENLSQGDLLAQFNGRILIADDNIEARMLLRGLLQHTHAQIAEVADGEKAQEKFTSFKPDIILMDWNMPKVNGLDAIRWIRQQNEGQAPKIIVMSAHAFSEKRQEALDAGADDFISKPLDAEKLYVILAHQMDLALSKRVETLDLQPQRSTELCRADLAALSSGTHAELLQALCELNPELISKALLLVQSENPGLAACLSEMAEKLQYRQLWLLLGISTIDGV